MARQGCHPKGTLPDRVDGRNGIAMERTWKLRGAYANWRMTLTTEPSEDEEVKFVDDWPTGPLERLGGHFTDMVSLAEYYRQLDPTSYMGASAHAQSH